MKDIKQQGRFIVIGHGLGGSWAVLDTHKGAIVGKPFASHADATADAQARERQSKIGKCGGEKPFDSVGFIMAYEADELGEEAIINGFQELINSGLCWQLQGHYGRMAQALIDAGLCHAKGATVERT